MSLPSRPHFPDVPTLGPRPALGYVGSPLDRTAQLRREAEALTAHPDTRTVLIGGELVALKARGEGEPADPLFTAAEATVLASGEPVFLGAVDGAGRLAHPFDPARRDEMEAQGLLVTDLRSIAMRGLVAADQLGPIACGKALLTWHRRHGFCANCGNSTRMVQAGWRRDCPSCGSQHFPRTDPVVIMLTMRGEYCLLGRQPQFPAGMWSCLAGFVEPGETIEEAVRRETLEEAGIRTGRVSYHATQPWPFPMSLMIGCLAEATSEEITLDEEELEGARWFSRAEVGAMLTRTHPDGLFTPPPVAIAHHLIRAFVEGVRA